MMLRLQEIALFQFKNHSARRFTFSESVVGICGLNGVGKTTLLDAIHYLAFTKSYFTRIDAQAVQKGQQGFRLDGKMELNGQLESVACILRETGRKEILVNGSAYEKLSQHIGRYPVVIIAPDDASLITEDSRERRTYLDQLLSQLDPLYLQSLISYNKILQQRNSLLKELSEHQTNDYSLLEVLDQQLVTPGNFIHEKRKELLGTLIPLIISIYQEIAQREEKNSIEETPTLHYQSPLLHERFETILQKNKSKDIYAQRTTQGVHRDEVEMLLNDQSFRLIASQGQRKSLLFALKLAEMETLSLQKGFPPLLLLDDVFEKLDEQRIKNLLQKVCLDSRAQIFITDTNAERLSTQLKALGISYQLLEL
jgi:DNA replication and repair protein RecF